MFRPLFDFLAADHANLARLLEVVTRDSGEIDLSAYHSFRATLLKHIGMEEKILLPALERAHGVSRETVTRLRRGYHTLSALLASTPSVGVVDTFRAVLADQDRLETGPGGLYEACERLDEGVRSALLSRVRSAPALPVAALREGPQTMDAARRVARPGSDVADPDGRSGDTAPPLKPR